MSTNPDISHYVMITPSVYQRWGQHARKLPAVLQNQGLTPDQVDDEIIVRHPTRQGCLQVQVRLKADDRVLATMDVEIGEWQWAAHLN